MPSRLESQLQGKYKGITFGVRKETLIAGRKRVVHDYPKSSTQYMEDMGNEPFSETIDLFFHGENYQDDFQKFLQAIRDPASGRLFSPTFGVFNSIIALPSSFESNQTAIGEITASIIFKETIEKPSPTQASTTEQDVAQLANESRLELKDNFEDQYAIPSTESNLSTVKTDSLLLADIIKTSTKSDRQANVFARKLDSSLLNPSGFADLLLSQESPVGILQNLATSYSGSDGFTIFKGLSVSGNDFSNSINDILEGVLPVQAIYSKKTAEDYKLRTDIPLWKENTMERIDRNKRRLVLVDTFRVVGLIGMMESMTTKTYTTTDEITRDQTELERYYQAIVENNSISTIISQQKDNLDKIKALTDEVLMNKSQQAFVVTEVTLVRPMSSFLLAYELYGEYLQNNESHEYMSDLIANLNRSQPRHILKGVVKVVEVGS